MDNRMDRTLETQYKFRTLITINPKARLRDSKMERNRCGTQTPYHHQRLNDACVATNNTSARISINVWGGVSND